MRISLQYFFIFVTISWPHVFSSEYRTRNNRPVFRKCAKNEIIMTENLPVGSVVTRVHAENEDNIENEGTIRYLIAEVHDGNFPFLIDSKDGTITINRIIDRDEPANEKKFHTTVLAQKRVYPWSYSYCSLVFTIDDENDNAPSFGHPLYSEMVSQNLSVGERVAIITATDIDEGQNSLVFYSISASQSKEKLTDGEYFRINNRTGEIFSTRKIDQTPEYIFELVITAEDMGDFRQFSTTKLNIHVINPKLQAPLFDLEAPQLIVSETRPISSLPLFSFKGFSNVERFPTVSFNLVEGTTEQTNKNETFKMEASPDEARILLSKPLDYERIANYSLMVRMENNNQLFREIRIKIAVLNAKDSVPILHNIVPLPILEDELPGFNVIKIQASKAERTDGNYSVSYRLQNDHGFFTIDSRTGVITTVAKLNELRGRKFVLKVIASENPTSNHLFHLEHNKNEMIIPIFILKKGDDSPHFSQLVYTASISDNSCRGARVEKIKVVGNVTDKVQFKILDGDDGHKFRIERKTGEIYLASTLIVGELQHHSLLVEASDKFFRGITTVEIDVINTH